MTTPEEITRRETRGSARLWFGLITAPVAWAIQLGVDWLLVEVISCAPAASSPGHIGSLPVLAMIALINAILFVAAAGSAFTAWRALGSIGGRGDRTPARRASWMARSGIINGIAFSLFIAASFAPVAMMSGCSS